MEKTEKIKESDYYSPENRLVPKINEIIDVLNSRLFEPTITIPNSDQFVLKEMKEPEKQEELTLEELKKIYFELVLKDCFNKDNSILIKLCKVIGKLKEEE